LDGARAAMNAGATTSLDQRLAAEEAWLGARLDGLREIRPALTALWSALSDQQRRDGEDLMAEHLGFMPNGAMKSTSQP
jgi:hypothetical protein